MPFAINGTNLNLAPYKQTWVDLSLGRDHNGIQLYSNTRNCLLEFDNAGGASYNQVAALANTGASITSIQLLNLDATSFNTYSNAGIGLELTRPSFESAYVNNWSVLVTGITF